MLADVDLDGARLLRRPAGRRRPTPGSRTTPTRGSTTLAADTYDHGYDGTGNWPFNTAYAAPLAGAAFVTRLRSLREAERFVAAGIPVVASIAFGSGELTGAPISATNGHLLVIVGFTARTATWSSTTRRLQSRGTPTYDRGQFELDRGWLVIGTPPCQEGTPGPRSPGRVGAGHLDARPVGAPGPATRRLVTRDGLRRPR